ncbi:MAG: 1-acyl-sn-glycerol-3-phosphate acyltransferase, partial [Acidobacteriaceae bacterium]|nr:1-acyl-sn-glycerol-3-phosphate acyltransferase [Acidobacteriaceae bacterium]
LFSIVLSFTYSYNWAAAWLLAIGISGGLFFVPLNAFLQERADPREKGRMLATNNFANTLGMILASLLLWLLHDVFHWRAASIIGALGALTMLATIYVVSILPANSLRIVLFALVRIFFRIRVVGTEHIPEEGGGIVVSNHVSYADAILIGCSTHRFVRFLMWKQYFSLKFAKPIFQALQAIPINPGSPKETIRSLRTAAEELKNGELVGIFPEGGLTRTGHVQAFQRGVERLMEYAPETPVIPIYLEGLWRHPFNADARRAFRDWVRAWRQPVTVMIGQPIRGPVAAAALRQRVLELGTEAVNLRKGSTDTLARC